MLRVTASYSTGNTAAADDVLLLLDGCVSGVVVDAVASVVSVSDTVVSAAAAVVAATYCWCNHGVQL